MGFGCNQVRETTLGKHSSVFADEGHALHSNHAAKDVRQHRRNRGPIMNDVTSTRPALGAPVECPPNVQPSINPVLHALAWMIVGGFLFGILNTAQKVLTHQMHPPQVVCLRYFMGSCLLIPFSCASAGACIGR